MEFGDKSTLVLTPQPGATADTKTEGEALVLPGLADTSSSKPSLAKGDVDGPLVQPGVFAVSDNKGGADQPLVQPGSLDDDFLNLKIDNDSVGPQIQPGGSRTWPASARAVRTSTSSAWAAASAAPATAASASGASAPTSSAPSTTTTPTTFRSILKFRKLSMAHSCRRKGSYESSALFWAQRSPPVVMTCALPCRSSSSS